jgi:hypothetical protein
MLTGTIPYEIMLGFTPRVPRVSMDVTRRPCVPQWRAPARVRPRSTPLGRDLRAGLALPAYGTREPCSYITRCQEKSTR